MAEAKFTEKELDDMVLKALQTGEKTVLDEGRKRSVWDRLKEFANRQKATPTEGETE